MVRFLMASRGEHQQDVATALGLAQSGLSNRFHGRTRWTLDEVDLLAAHFGVAPHQLVEGTWNVRDTMPPQRLATGRYSTTPPYALSAYDRAA